jgi:hypothetical protein
MEENSEEFNKVIDRLEPLPNIGMDEADSDSLKTTSIVSIAISLKRIADSMAAQKYTAEYHAGVAAMIKTATP